jgi:N-acyl homoserine lactone hydrolase
MSLSVGDSAGRFDHIWSLWRHKPGNVLVPGHDLPMVLDADMPRYLGERDGTITAWLGDTLEKTTEINLYVT